MKGKKGEVIGQTWKVRAGNYFHMTHKRCYSKAD